MSHFSVLVIGSDIERQLQPFHEYECTGIDDEYVIDVDVTDDLRADFAAYGKGEDFATFVEGWSSTKERDGRYYRHTNPNKKWDYWRIGGRWNGMLRLKEKATGLAVAPRWDSAGPAAPGYADQALKGDIDFAQMRNDSEVKARALWKATREITGNLSWESWDDTRIRYLNVEEARREYWAQPAIELLKASGREAYKWDMDDNLALDEDTYASRQRAAACTFFAFLRDGQWTERGLPGWFACVSDEVSKVQWDTMFNDMLDALPDDTLLTVVDCHI